MVVQHVLPSAEHAAAAPALDADDGADSTFGTDDGVPLMMIPPDDASDFGSEPDTEGGCGVGSVDPHRGVVPGSHMGARHRPRAPAAERV